MEEKKNKSSNKGCYEKKNSGHITNEYLLCQASLVIGTACLQFVIQKQKLMGTGKAADVRLMFTICYDACSVSVVQSLSGNT